ncbi:DUF924 family protein [Fangia hongkongensis]|uniref:DUF924 family protein n=1 Tax=Fangia hongkongensis TaxID=270495 RepID=UPI00037F1443|nr:DUF924 family protein [Fangia hongkongensis]MBK2126086.1 DUF924 domain-containing protein [Fangia hongkongensis]
MHFKTILDFWFQELTANKWYVKDEKVDNEIRSRFSDIHQSVALGECASWRKTAHGSLAEIIVLDQFSRNMFRGTEKAFSYDSMALALAQFARSKGFQKNLNDVERQFLHMPFMHSESPIIQEESLRLFGEDNSYAVDHKAVIDQFGRFPHRNNILQRESSEEELSYLETHSGW